MEIDPVCGMTVDPKTAAGKSEYEGKTFYFCSLNCKRDFDREPNLYANPGLRGTETGPKHEHSA